MKFHQKRPSFPNFLIAAADSSPGIVIFGLFQDLQGYYCLVIKTYFISKFYIG
jgi:hypothetical protein